MELKGTYTALITPFKEGQLDEPGLVCNIHDQLKADVEGLVILGTTGEAPTLSAQEQARIIDLTVQEVQHKKVIIVGTGTNCTQTTIEKTKLAQKLGADAALVITPYYNKPTQKGIFLHFEALTQEVTFPICLYNHLGRTGVSIEVPTLEKLASLPHLIGIKETSSDLTRISQIKARISSKHPSFSILSGCDELTLEMIQRGAQGVISVVSNLKPREMKRLVDQALEGKIDQAFHEHKKLSLLMDLLCMESNPIPIKEAMKFCGLPSGLPRLPLCELSDSNKAKLHDYLKNMELVQI